MNITILVDHRVSGYYWRMEHEKVDMGRGPHQSQAAALEDCKRQIAETNRRLRQSVLISITRKEEGGEPCGECHIQPGETCDICGAVG